MPLSYISLTYFVLFLLFLRLLFSVLVSRVCDEPIAPCRVRPRELRRRFAGLFSVAFEPVEMFMCMHVYVKISACACLHMNTFLCYACLFAYALSRYMHAIRHNRIEHVLIRRKFKYTHTHTHTNTHTHIHTYTHIHAHTDARAHGHINTPPHAPTRMHAHAHKHMTTATYTNRHINKRTHK